MSVHRENAGREEHECVNLQDKRLDGSQCESKRERERERERERDSIVSFLTIFSLLPQSIAVVSVVVLYFLLAIPHQTVAVFLQSQPHAQAPVLQL